MKSRFGAVIFLLMAVVAGCTKENNLFDSPNRNEAAIQAVQTEDEAFVSKWEPIGNWSIQKAGDNFSFTKPLDKSFSKETVLVFVRNLWVDDPTFKEQGEKDEPLMMPFSFLPFNKKPSYTEQWNYDTKEGQLTIELNIYANQEQPSVNQNLQLQYIVIPQKLLFKKGQTEESVHEMAYEEVIQNFGLTSSSF